MVKTGMKQDMRSLSKEAIAAWLEANGEPSYRAGQIWKWLWHHGASGFEEMTNLSKALRTSLDTHFGIYPARIDRKQVSKDGTLKFRLQLFDGHVIESVLIPVPAEKRYTVCVSSQVGCSLSCTFCATGRMKRERNLTAGEIVDQYRIANAASQDKYQHHITNIVYMGMGEPLLAYRPVMESIQHLCREDGLNISPKRITVSTAGIAKMIKMLGDDMVRFNLALSLHAANDKKRHTIMPINAQNNLEALMGALEYFYVKTGSKVSYEYIAFQGFNDSLQDARELIGLCQRFPVHVNIIEYNAVEGVPFTKASRERVDQFARVLRDNGIMVTVRRSRGKDIDAACGQLANKD